jgi:hypothetical protein
MGDSFRNTRVIPAKAGIQVCSQKTMDSLSPFVGTKGRGNDDMKNPGISDFRDSY